MSADDLLGLAFVAIWLGVLALPFVVLAVVVFLIVRIAWRPPAPFRAASAVFRLLGIVIISVCVALGAVDLLLDRPWSIDTYRVVGDHTLALSVATEWLGWTRVVSVVESADAVTVEMKSFQPPLAGTGGQDQPYLVQLAEPIGARTVIDGSTGMPVPLQPATQ